jgi:hypothetical protein
MELITRSDDERLDRIKRDNTVTVIGGIDTRHEPKSTELALVINSLRAMIAERDAALMGVDTYKRMYENSVKEEGIIGAALNHSECELEEAERKLCAVREAINAHLDGHKRYVETVIKGLPPDCVCPSCKRFRAALSSSTPCHHAAEADALRETMWCPDRAFHDARVHGESRRKAGGEG